MSSLGKMVRQVAPFKNDLRWFRLAYAYAEKWLSARAIHAGAKSCLPDFLGIGAQKAGTSWLYENLRHHPELYLPEPKELHYFDWDFLESLRSYSARFEPGRQKVKGEITPGYGILSLRRIRLIRAIMPDVKLIFFMRNPIERAWSQALMNLVSIPGRKYEEVHESEFDAHLKHERSVRRGDYLTILDNWLRVFPSERLYIGFFEDIASSPQELLGEIFAHLGVSREVDWESFPFREVINRSPSVSMPQKYRESLQKMYCQDIEILYERFGDRVAAWRCM
ncbi:MAG: sulfotransferase [Chloroflexota bacterium]|nr:sulfotransferase [Chloroflexota bacterium]